MSAVSSLEVLASSERLDRGDLAGFYIEARRALEPQRRHRWATIVLKPVEPTELVAVIASLARRASR